MSGSAYTLVTLHNPDVTTELVDGDDHPEALVQFQVDVAVHAVQVDVIVDNPTGLRMLADRIYRLADDLDEGTP